MRNFVWAGRVLENGAPPKNMGRTLIKEEQATCFDVNVPLEGVHLSAPRGSKAVYRLIVPTVCSCVLGRRGVRRRLAGMTLC